MKCRGELQDCWTQSFTAAGAQSYRVRVALADSQVWTWGSRAAARPSTQPSTSLNTAELHGQRPKRPPPSADSTVPHTAHYCGSGRCGVIVEVAAVTGNSPSEGELSPHSHGAHEKAQSSGWRQTPDSALHTQWHQPWCASARHGVHGAFCTITKAAGCQPTRCFSYRNSFSLSTATWSSALHI